MAKYVFLDGNKTDSRYGYFVGNKWIVKVGLRTESDDSYDIGCKSCLALTFRTRQRRRGTNSIQYSTSRDYRQCVNSQHNPTIFRRAPLHLTTTRPFLAVRAWEPTQGQRIMALETLQVWRTPVLPPKIKCLLLKTKYLRHLKQN